MQSQHYNELEIENLRRYGAFSKNLVDLATINWFIGSKSSYFLQKYAIRAS